MELSGAVTILGAFGLDLAIGDPRWMVHPVELIGGFIGRGEQVLRRLAPKTPQGEFAAGAALAVITVTGVYVLTYLVAGFLQSPFGPRWFWYVQCLLMLYLCSSTLALKGLIDSVRQVLLHAQAGEIERARTSLSMIVGRETKNLDEAAIRRASIETLAENLSDGVIAPLFYLALGGLPLAMAYKAVNTLDSMIGYKNDRFLNFGRAAARLDDLVNYLPARLTGLFIVLGAFLSTLSAERALSAFKIFKRDGKKHTSPNAGLPESAMAGALGVSLGGPSEYFGKVVEKPWIGEGPQMVDDAEAGLSVRISTAASAAFALCAGAAAYLLQWGL